MKKTLTILSLLGLSFLPAFAIEFGDIPEEYPLYSTPDPFAIGVATNAYNKAVANAVAILANSNGLVAANANIAASSNRIDAADAAILDASNRINTATVHIAAASNSAASATSVIAVHTNDAAAHSELFAVAGTNAQGYASAAQSNAVEFAGTNRVTKLWYSDRYIDGLGNVYVVSNFWNMGLTSAVTDAYGRPPNLTNHVFTGYGEYYDGVGSFPSETAWTFGWSEETGFYVYTQLGLGGQQWIAVTNQYVLEIENYPEYGYVYITPYSTTNLLATLATETWATDIISSQTTGKVDRAGDTMTGALLTTRDFTTDAPAGNEVPSADWVRSLAMRGEEWYFTSATTNGFGEKTANFVALSRTPVAQFTNVIASPIASDTYLAGGIAINGYGQLRSPVTFEIYAARTGGSGSSLVPAHAELYYVYHGSTNHLGDWETANQNIAASATPARYEFTVPFVEPAITAAVHVIGYLKTGTVSGPACGINIYGGGVYPSHLDIEGIDVGDSVSAAEVTNIVRTASISTQTWTAEGTNAVYVTSWDVTNGTFRVLEVLP